MELSEIEVKTSFGVFCLRLNHKAAPQTCGYFQGLAITNMLSTGSIFRIVTEKNGKLRSESPIKVIQMGIEDSTSLLSEPIKHETTKLTGLQHMQWAVSAARIGVGENYPSFFVCMRDEPALDFGGTRHPDGQGFAVFGNIIAGFRVLETIYNTAEEDEYLKCRIPILTRSIGQE